MSRPTSGFLLGLSALAEAGVDFVLVGVGGINFYARNPGHAFATLDLDALLAPTVANLRTALGVFARLGYAFEAGGEPFVDFDDDTILRRIVQNGASLSAHHEEAGQFDLLLSVSGFSYSELADDATSFRVVGVDVRVGKLEKLLRSKQSSGRPKDLEFLRMFERASEEHDS